LSPSDTESLKWQADADRPRRFDLRAALGPIADVLVFLVATALGLALGPAHLVSFCVATLVYYLFKARSEATLGGRTLGATLHGQLLAVGLFALFLRGGVLALITQVWGWPVPLAILIAVAVTMGITLPGYGLVLASPAWKVGGGTRWRVIAIGIVVCAFALRLIYLAQVELLPEETYYWSYGQHLDLSYLDHPPMVAWLIRLGTALCGNTEFGVRLGALCCSMMSAFFIYRLTRNLFGEASALVALVLMQVLPFYFLSGMLMTPDAPLMAAWAATLCFLERALVAGRSSSWWAVGVCLGLGLVSKYTISLLVPAMVVFVILDAPSRRWLWRWEPYAALLVALVIFSPVIIWNAQHEWASFAFQTSRRLAERPRFSLHRLILSVLILLTPTGLLTLLASPYVRGSKAVAHTNGNAARDTVRRWRFIRAATLVPLTVFTLFSLRHEVKIDWTGGLWLAAVPALAFAILSLGEKAASGWRSLLHSAWAPTAAVLLLSYAGGLHYLVLGIPGLHYSRHIELAPVGWRDFSRQIDAVAQSVRETTGTRPLIVGMDRYAIAASLTFYSPDQAQAIREISSGHLFGQRGLMYERWFPAAQQDGRTLLLVGWDARDVANAIVSPYVQRMDAVGEGTLTRQGTPIRHFYYRVAYGYHSVPSTEPPPGP